MISESVSVHRFTPDSTRLDRSVLRIYRTTRGIGLILSENQLILGENFADIFGFQFVGPILTEKMVKIRGQ